MNHSILSFQIFIIFALTKYYIKQIYAEGHIFTNLFLLLHRFLHTLIHVSISIYSVIIRGKKENKN